MKLIPIQRGGVLSESVGLLPAGTGEVLSATSKLYESVGFVVPWVCYLAIASDNVVGTCGFKAPPNQGRVEIAYYTFPGYEGKGIATQMTRLLVSIARDANPDLVVAAQTLPDRNASHRVLEKLGFVRVGTLAHPEDGTVLEWHKSARA